MGIGWRTFLFLPTGAGNTSDTLLPSGKTDEGEDAGAAVPLAGVGNS